MVLLVALLLIGTVRRMRPSSRKAVVLHEPPFSASSDSITATADEPLAALKFGSDHAVHAAMGASGGPDRESERVSTGAGGGAGFDAALSAPSGQRFDDDNGASLGSAAAAGSEHDSDGFVSRSSGSAAAWPDDEEEGREPAGQTFELSNSLVGSGAGRGSEG